MGLDDRFAGAVAAALGRHLVLDVETGGTGLLEFPDGAVDAWGEKSSCCEWKVEATLHKEETRMERKAGKTETDEKESSTASPQGIDWEIIKACTHREKETFRNRKKRRENDKKKTASNTIDTTEK